MASSKNTSAYTLHQNTTNNSRSGQAYRSYAGDGGTYHVYASGKRVFVKDKSSSPRRNIVSNVVNSFESPAKGDKYNKRRKMFGFGFGAKKKVRKGGRMTG